MLESQTFVELPPGPKLPLVVGSVLDDCVIPMAEDLKVEMASGTLNEPVTEELKVELAPGTLNEPVVEVVEAAVLPNPREIELAPEE